MNLLHALQMENEKLMLYHEDGSMSVLHPDSVYYFESVDNKVFAYGKSEVSELKQKLYKLEQRFAEINAREPEELTAEEAAALAEAEAMDDGSSVSLDAFKAELEGYSGKLVLRIPRSLHKHLKEEAEIEGVSLNQYMLYKLSR